LFFTYCEIKLQVDFWKLLERKGASLCIRGGKEKREEETWQFR